jgi:hypothetical protein
VSELQSRQVELAHLAGIIERLAGELALAEEPACFEAALEDGAEKAPEEDAQRGTPQRMTKDE